MMVRDGELPIKNNQLLSFWLDDVENLMADDVENLMADVENC